ncbi:MAG TPA: non-ribosomal peptide synthetase [Pyrinomonadaceae bacterium]|jgi:amino acid adenylation domain-containing protein|nr:non-ribosomal peptide synthetase [Pyrinomonadaceae bacterium]
MSETTSTQTNVAGKVLPDAALAQSARTPIDQISIARTISAHASANPDAHAVIAGEKVLTYGELERRSNRLANYLLELGVTRETIVAICLERSFESIIGTLAVLKAGGAFLPLDPKLPLERLNFLVDDARPRVLIKKGEIPGPIESSSFAIIDLIGEQEIDKYSAEPPMVKSTNDQLAYVIYTSGSTGQPKGVEITLANLSNLITWHRTEFKVTSADRASHLAAVGFDAAVWEVWPCLTAGACLYLPSDCVRLSPEALRDWMVDNEITISFVPTVLAETLIEFDWPAGAALRFLLTGADTLHRRPQRLLPFELVNNYGPTETTVVATSGCVSGGENNNLPTIGRAIRNTQIYLLDEKLSAVAPGETGEIFIGGAGVGRGYFNRPDLTAERFMRDPFSTQPDARLYRTGDLARELPSGEIAYIGRADEQIKILGYRIEPAEIEATIDRHPAIASNVVAARSYDCSGSRLVAYLKMRNGSRPTAVELREFLKASLPDYMIPAQFVQIDQLPLNANGKVDRRSLPELTGENRLPEETFAGPRTPTETRVAGIISELFKVETVGVNDNFFLLGGHSLLGAQLVIKIRAAFGVDLPLRAIFDAPTIAALSQTIEQSVIARIEAMSEAEAQTLVA